MTRKYGGTGLGLAISRQLVQLMDGNIGLNSNPEGGSVFWFELELPLAVAIEQTVSHAAGRMSGAAWPARKVLVAEDNTANQLVIHLLLEKLGLAHEIVGDGQVALARLAAKEYAAVLMDCQMPVLDGYETARLIRAGEGNVLQPRLPIIALTAHAMASDREKCLSAGMNDYLSKPVRLEELQRAFEKIGVHTQLQTVPGVSPGLPATTGVLDSAQVSQLRKLPGRNGPTLLSDLIDMALQELPVGLAQLHALAAQRNRVDFENLAHRLAGSAANLGASGLRIALQEVERAGNLDDWVGVERLRPGLDRQWQLVRDTLQNL
jgi:CheY-like chemotaxis protein